MRPTKYFLPLLLISSCTLALATFATDDTNAPATPLPAEALKLGDLFRGETIKIVQQYNDAIRNLPALQQTQLLALQKKLQEGGDLDGYLAVAAELKRFTAALKAEPDPFERIPEMPESTLVTKPESLRAIQDQYIKAHKDKLDIRDKREEDMTRSYITQLENVKTDLTIKGRIVDAISVKKEVERIRKGLEDKSFVAQALSAVAPKPVTPTTESASSDASPTGKAVDWAKWQFDRTGNFTSDAKLFANPDLPDQLAIEFNPKTGKAHITGHCEVEQKTVGMYDCTWFGKAIQWKVKDLAALNATFVLQSKEIATGPSAGPKAYLMLLGDKGPLGDALDVSLMWPDATLTLTKDADANRCTLCWIQGKIKKTVDLPASGSVRVLFGIALRNTGERCDTTLVMQ